MENEGLQLDTLAYVLGKGINSCIPDGVMFALVVCQKDKCSGISTNMGKCSIEVAALFEAAAKELRASAATPNN